MPASDLARAAEDRFHRDVIPALRRQGWRPRVIPYDGYGSPLMARVIARMVMRPAGAPAEGPLFRSLPEEMPTSAQEVRTMALTGLLEAQRGWRSFVDAPVPYLPVTITVGTRTVRTRADRSGYVDVVVRHHNLDAGWHDVTIRAAGAGAPVTSRVMVIPPGPQLGVVSDIDDTAMVTHVPRVMVAAWNLLVKHSVAREPVPGMAELLRRVRRAHPGAPVVYLSTGAWNVVPTMRAFFSRHGFPRGPMLMTDWGPTNTGWFRSGIEHKRTELRRIMLDLPEVTWLLVGDDGQHDPLIYSEVARHHADRVAAVAVRRLTTGVQVLSGGLTAYPMGLGPAARTLAECGVPVVFGQDGYELARLLPPGIVAPV